MLQSDDQKITLFVVSCIVMIIAGIIIMKTAKWKDGQTLGTNKQFLAGLALFTIGGGVLMFPVVIALEHARSNPKI